MALTQEQIVMAGVYGEIRHVANRFFTRRIKNGKIPLLTNAETISYEEVKKELKKAKILRREEEFPIAKIGGSVVKSVTPEVIKESIPFFPKDQLNRQPGEQIFIGGRLIDKRTYERDRRISTIKQSIEAITEEISTSVFLKGLYKSPDTLNEVKYTFNAAETVNKSDIVDWAIWTTKQVNDFSKDRKVQPTEILVGENVFNDILQTYNASSNKIIPATATRKITEDGQWELHLELFGFDFVMLPQATDTEGKTIDTKNLMMMYNDQAYYPAYAGVVNVVGTEAIMEATEVLIRETPPHPKTGIRETLGESAYCPIITNPSLIKQFKITGL